LENSNFTEEEVEAILESANDLSWERAEGADAEVVVQALSLARKGFVSKSKLQLEICPFSD